VQIRSSITHPLQIAEVAVPTGGSIGITFCPGKCGPSLYGHVWKRELDADLDVINQQGAVSKSAHSQVEVDRDSQEEKCGQRCPRR
jgi:hypothetical protein